MTDLEEEKKFHEKKFKFFQLRNTMGNGHGGGKGGGMLG